MVNASANRNREAPNQKDCQRQKTGSWDLDAVKEAWISKMPFVINTCCRWKRLKSGTYACAIYTLVRFYFFLKFLNFHVLISKVCKNSKYGTVSSIFVILNI